MKKDNAGFSLIELIVVIAIMVIVAGIGAAWIGNISGYRARECSGKISSSLTSSKIKALSKERKTGDAYWELYLDSDNKYYVNVRYPDYESGAITYDEDISKVGKTSNITVKYTDVDGEHTVDAHNSLILCYDRSTGAIYEGYGAAVDKTKKISKISVSAGIRTYNIDIVAKTGKVSGRY